MATTGDVLDAFAYYIGHGGYCEKKDGDARYLTRAVDNFQANAGDANWTYMGKLCGINPGAWCAMMVSTAVYEACGSDRTAAKKAMWGVWPYTACNQLWDAADDAHRFYGWYQRWTLGRGDRTDYTPEAGDVVIFSDNGTIRTHTGMVYAVDGQNIYTYEGNSGSMARKRSYSLRSSYIFGYVKLDMEQDGADGIALFQKRLGVAADGVYGPVTKKAAVLAHQIYLNETYGAGLAEDGVWGPMTYYATVGLRMGDDNEDVAIWQGMLYCRAFDPQGIDGAFGRNTELATEMLQMSAGLNQTGIADRYTWAKAFGAGRPAHTVLRMGDRGAEVKYLQELLTIAGYPVKTDGSFGGCTEAAVTAFQTASGLEPDGIVGPLTWAALE